MFENYLAKNVSSTRPSVYTDFLFFLLSSPLFIFPIILGTFGFAFVFSMLILLVIVYFRDLYRATNYGVNDLVEFIRQIDKGLLLCRMKDEQFDQERDHDPILLAKAQDYWTQHPIKLSFIGHSMGGQVTTQIVRILMELKQLQTVLSPERYVVDVMGENRKQVRGKILDKSSS